MKFRVLICAALTVALGLPIAAVMGWLPAGDLRLSAARIERALAILFALGCGVYFFLRARKQGALSHSASFAPGMIPAGDPRPVALRDVLLVSLPGLPLVVYTLLFTLRAHEALFLVDLDFTGISSAMNNAAKGHGLLTTPFFHTGTGGGYLGHHFSPTLLAFVPFYALANHVSVLGMERATHLVYGLLLWGVLAVGVVAWARLLLERLGNVALAGAMLAAFMFAYPLHRLVLSFHYELPAFACSALVFIALRENRPVLLWCALLGWVGVKEDAALYVLLFSLALVTTRAHRRVALRMAIFCLLYFLLANFVLRPYFAGGQGPVWNYWKGGPLEGVMNLVTAPGALAAPWALFTSVLGEVPGVLSRLPMGSLFDLLLAFAFLPLLSRRLILFTLPLIFAIHLVSGHRWHATFYGHYSYSVLPFLMLGMLHGFTILAGALTRARKGVFVGGAPVIALGMLAVAAYSAAGDKETPLPPPAADPRAKPVARLLRDLPRGACLRTQTFFTAHAPLDIYTFPLEIPRGNPMRDKLPPQTWYTADVNGAPGCGEFYILLDSENFAPYYTRAYMEKFMRLTTDALKRGELERVKIASGGRLHLYRARSRAN